MRSAKSWGWKVLIVVVLCGFEASVGVPQQTTTTQQTTTPQAPTAGSRDPFGSKQENDEHTADLPGEMQQKLQDARQTERQKKLVEDTDKLLTLATQLHNDVAKTNKDIMSLDVVRRADEIEKLAHAVKERMKG
jgi:hypothetical protein